MAKEAKTNAMRMLERAKVTYTSHEYPHEEGQAVDGANVARLTGQDTARVFKTLVTQGADRNYYVFVVPVLAELDLKKAAKAAGVKSVAMIHVADINKVTGYIRGGCSPVGMKKQFVTVYDESCLAQQTMLVSGGRIGTQIEMRPGGPHQGHARQDGGHHTGARGMMRLDKYLAERTGMTRSESRKAVTKGRVSIDGAVCRKADTQLDEHTAAVALDGVPLAGAYRKFVYIMLNKPEGVVSASRDKKDTTVVGLVAADFPRRELFPAGRLDKTSTGFVLLTDDGALAHDILSPAHHVEKQYVVTLDTPLTDAMRRGFAAGVTLTDGETMAPAGVEPLTGDGLTVQVTLRQGVYHQIKRMFGVFDAGVNALHRESIGGVALDPALAPGQWRELTAEEVERLRTR